MSNRDLLKELEELQAIHDQLDKQLEAKNRRISQIRKLTNYTRDQIADMTEEERVAILREVSAIISDKGEDNV